MSGSAATASAAARAGKRKGARAREVVFVDVCGGPGSFAQALLHAVRRAPKTRVRGYGMTLAHPTLSWYSELLGCADFTPTFGVDGTGSVYDPANVEALVSICRADRVGFVMGDGGFDVPHEQLTMQEAITARIVYSQWFIALRLLADGGSLVLKLFETSSVFLRSMLVLSCLFFSNVAIAKPAHSRVVNSERYLSCSGFRAGVFTARWLRTLADVHATAFGDGVAPFTLLPDVDLAATCSGPAGSSSSSALRRILRRIELSITATATRQAAALSMILREFRDKQLRDEAAAPAVP